jgi:hypothetical protein
MGARVAVVLMLALASCAHAPRGHFDAAADRVCAGHVCYHVGGLGSDWRLVHQEGAAIGFYSDAVGAVIEANASCRDDADAAPLKALTRQLLIGYTDRQIVEQRTMMLDGREALRTRVEARLDGVPMMLDLVVLKRNGCIFDLSYAAPPPAFERGSADFARFVDGFADARSIAARGAERGDDRSR